MPKDEAREVRSAFWMISLKQWRAMSGLQGRKRKDHIFILEKEILTTS